MPFVGRRTTGFRLIPILRIPARLILVLLLSDEVVDPLRAHPTEPFIKENILGKSQAGIDQHVRIIRIVVTAEAHRKRIAHENASG